jgi:hypothetical protein
VQVVRETPPIWAVQRRVWWRDTLTPAAVYKRRVLEGVGGISDVLTAHPRAGRHDPTWHTTACRAYVPQTSFTGSAIPPVRCCSTR